MTTVLFDLLRSLDLIDGFVLQPVVLSHTTDLSSLIAALEKSHRKVARVAPARGEWGAIVETLERLPGSYDVVLLAGEAPLSASQRRGLAALNLARDRIIKRLDRPLVLCGTEAFISECAGAMPDFWSVRATTRRLWSSIAGFSDPAIPAAAKHEHERGRLQLTHFLASVFSAEELHHFVALHFHELAHRVPWGQAPLLQLAQDVVLHLEREGNLHELFNSLAYQLPRRRAEIEALRAACLE